MSIFTRLTLFIALAVIAIGSFIVFVASQIIEQDQLTLDYRELARKENAIMQKPIDNDLLLKTIDEVLAESQA